MTTLLISLSLLLGLLAFFEPCTIASHGLFAARAHGRPRRDCCSGLLTVWLTRSLLLGGLMLLATWLLPAPQWGPWLPTTVLAVLALLYVISRRVYLPVPHLEFHRLIPGGQRLPEAVRLGLTLPACTLPLVVVVTGLAVTVDSPMLSALAGVLFATLFTLPLAVTSLHGLDSDTRDLLSRAATASPWITAVLLLSVAAFLALPGLSLDTEALRAALRQASWAGIGLAFVAGFLFSFNPVSFASIPVVLAYVTRAGEPRRALVMGLAFVSGMILTHAVLGVAAALGGDWVRSLMGRQWGLVLGPILIVLGLMWAGWLRLRLPWFGMRGRPVSGVWGAFLLGIPFSVAVCPFCTPALLVTLTASAAIGSPLFGLALLLAFALGRSIPILLGAWSMGWLESLRLLARHQRGLEVLGGVTLILTGLYLLNEYLFIIRY